MLRWGGGNPLRAHVCSPDILLLLLPPSCTTFAQEKRGKEERNFLAGEIFAPVAGKICRRHRRKSLLRRRGRFFRGTKRKSQPGRCTNIDGVGGLRDFLLPEEAVITRSKGSSFVITYEMAVCVCLCGNCISLYPLHAERETKIPSTFSSLSKAIYEGGG